MNLLSVAGLCAFLSAGAKSHDYNGRIVLPKSLPNNSGTFAPSWWSTADAEPYKDKLGLENTVLEVYRLGDAVPSYRGTVSPDGYFRLDGISEEHSDRGFAAVIKFHHPAYRFHWLLVEDSEEEANGVAIDTGVMSTIPGRKIFAVDPAEGVNRSLREIPFMVVQPVRFDAPYPDPKPFSPFGLLKNPLVLIGLGGLFLSYGLPYMTGGVDLRAMQEEARALRLETQGETVEEGSYKSALLTILSADLRQAKAN